MGLRFFSLGCSTFASVVAGSTPCLTPPFLRRLPSALISVIFCDALELMPGPSGLMVAGVLDFSRRAFPRERFDDPDATFTARDACEADNALF